MVVTKTYFSQEQVIKISIYSTDFDPTLSKPFIYELSYDASLVGDDAGNTLNASSLPVPSGWDALYGRYFSGGGGNDAITGYSGSYHNWNIFQGSSDTSLSNREIDILTGTTSGEIVDSFFLCARLGSGYQNCYRGTGYAIIKNLNLGYDEIFVKADLGYGDLLNGKRMGFSVSNRSVSGVGSAATDTVISLGRSNDVIGIIQDRSLSLSQLAETLYFIA